MPRYIFKFQSVNGLMRNPVLAVLPMSALPVVCRCVGSVSMMRNLDPVRGRVANVINPGIRGGTIHAFVV